MTDETKKNCMQLLSHLEGVSNVACSMLDAVEMRLYGNTEFCIQCRYAGCDHCNTAHYGCSESFRWGGRYIYYCTAGLVFTASPLLGENGTSEGGLIAGPMILGEEEDTLSALDAPHRSLAAALPVLSTARVRDLSEILAVMTAYVNGVPHLPGIQMKTVPAHFTDRNKFSDYEDARYFLDGERQLRAFVAANERAKAQALLNDLLGHIYFSSSFELSTIKARVMELIVVLSRAVIEAGAEMSEILLYNAEYFSKIEHFTDLEEMSVWLSGVMHRFINYTFDFRRVKHADVVHKIMEYVRGNYHRKITLDDIAGQVYLSRSYISSLFKEETGCSLTGYINHVRIEQSKRLLADNKIALVDIAGLCGFEDQSYFTKVFKKETGMPPNRYRALHAGSVQYFEKS